MPFTCDACGGRTWPDLLPAVETVLRCPHCANERPFLRPRLLIVTGTAGVGKSTLCGRLAGRIEGAVLVDADIFAEDVISVVPPQSDYPAFWRLMLRLAHEVAQSGVGVVYFSTMLPEQVLGNTRELSYFESVHFLCLSCPPDVLRERLGRRHSDDPTADQLQRWVDFNGRLVTAAGQLPLATVVDAGGAIEQLEDEIRTWIEGLLRP